MKIETMLSYPHVASLVSSPPQPVFTAATPPAATTSSPPFPPLTFRTFSTPSHAHSASRFLFCVDVTSTAAQVVAKLDWRRKKKKKKKKRRRRQKKEQEGAEERLEEGHGDKEEEKRDGYEEDHGDKEEKLMEEAWRKTLSLVIKER